MNQNKFSEKVASLVIVLGKRLRSAHLADDVCDIIVDYYINDAFTFDEIVVNRVPVRYLANKLLALREDYYDGIFRQCVKCAIKVGNTDILDYINKSKYTTAIWSASEQLVQCDHFHVFKWFHANCKEFIFSQRALKRAAKNGNLAIVKFLHKHCKESDATYAMDDAAENGHLETVVWLHEHRTEGCTKNAMDFASKNGHLDIVKFLHEHRTEGCTAYAMNVAAENGHLEVVKWLHKNRLEGCNQVALSSAASHGHLEVVKFLYSIACGYPQRQKISEEYRWFNLTNSHFLVKVVDDFSLPGTFRGAVESGNLELVQWIYDNMSKHEIARIHLLDINELARKGYIHIIKWLYERRDILQEKLDWECKYAIDWAARNGHLDTIMWLHEKDQRCSEDAINQAALGGHLETIKWLHAHKTKACTWKAMSFAATAGHLETVVWLHTHCPEGCSWNALSDAARNGHLAVVKWLHENQKLGCPIDAIAHAAVNRHVDVVKYLYIPASQHSCTSSQKSCISANRSHQTKNNTLLRDIIQKPLWRYDYDIIFWIYYNKLM